MLGRRGPEQYEFFAGSLRELIPDEHVLARVDRVLDLIPNPIDQNRCAQSRSPMDMMRPG